MLNFKAAFVAAAIMLVAGCASNKKAGDTAEAAAAKPVTVSTATAISKDVPADFQETGTFVADESSDIAPPVAGRVISTPVDVGARVTKGQVICELDHRDAELKLQQARAQLDEATAGVRQAQSRIGWVSGAFNADRVPEVAGGPGAHKTPRGAGTPAAAG